MSTPGDAEALGLGDDLLVKSRAALLGAVEALAQHAAAVIVIGAQAVYIRTPAVSVALAEATKDSDLAVDPRLLGEDPLVEAAMATAGFIPDPVSQQPGAWMTPQGIPVDLMVPEQLAGPGNATTRGARVPPHSKRSMRRARGLEAALVDNSVEIVRALDPADSRAYSVKVAGASALVVAKMHKVAERIDTPTRLHDKDAHDVYRIFQGVATVTLVEGFKRLLADDVSRPATEEALTHVGTLLAAGPEATGAMMAGRAEEGVGEPEIVALALSILAQDLLDGL